MQTIKIWHNPKCSKSRASFQLLEEKGIKAEVISYMDKAPTVSELKSLLVMLDIEPRALMRTKEDIYKTLNLKNEINDETLILAMVENPKLIERPIVIKGNKAVIGRPIEKVIELLG